MSLEDDAKRPAPAREPLKDNPRRKYGPQKDKLAQCAKHGEFYPAGESCPYCLGWHETLKRVEPTELDWASDNYGYDADGHYWP